MPALSRAPPCPDGTISSSYSPSSTTQTPSMQLLVRGVDGRVSHCVRLPPNASVADLQRAVHARTGVPAEDQVLTHGGRLLSPARGALALLQGRGLTTTTRHADAADGADADGADTEPSPWRADATAARPLISLFPDAQVPRDACVHLSLRLLGGKGGFGAQLRAQGRDSRTDNFDACRDLSGRRVKHAEAEEALRRWEAEAPERELERAAKAHLAEMARKQRREARELEFDAQGAREEQERAVARAGEGVRGAVAEALARFGAAGAGADAKGGGKGGKGGKGGADRDDEEEEEEGAAGPSSGGTTATAAAAGGSGGSGSSGDEAAAAGAAAPRAGGKRAAAGKNVEDGAAAAKEAEPEPPSAKRAKPAAAPPPARARGMLALVEGSDDDDDSSSGNEDA